MHVLHLKVPLLL